MLNQPGQMIRPKAGKVVAETVCLEQGLARD